MTRPIGIRALLFLVLAIASTAPAFMLASRIDEPALQRELEAVRERHLLVARNLASTLERYASDVKIVFRATAKGLRDGIVQPHVSDLLEGLNFYHVCIVDPNGKVVASALPPEGKAPSRVPERVLGLFKPLPPLGEIKFTPVQPGPDGTPRIFLAMRLPGEDFAIAAINTKYFQEIQKRLTFGIAGHAAIVDQSGKVLAHPREDWRIAMKDLRGVDPVDRMIAGESGVATFYSPALNTEMVAGYSTVQGAGWGAMIPQPLTELEASASRLQNIVLSMLLFGALVAAGLSWWLAGYLIRPVIAVTRAARELANSEPSAPVVLGRGTPTELRSLVESFDTMVKRLAETNARLRLSENRFKNFAETAADWFWETDRDLLFTYLSEQFQPTTGSPSDALLGKSLRNVVGEHVTTPAARKQFFEQVDARLPFNEFQLRWIDVQDMQRIQHVSGIPVVSEDGEFQGYRGTGRDVTMSHQLSERLSHQAKHDDLTGLTNRREFEQQLGELLEHTNETNAEHALCFLDLDQFKLVNDTCGHVAGDELLRQIGTILLARTRKGDLVARLGGDEFGIVLRHCSLAEAVQVATAVRDTICELRFMWQGHVFTVGVSIGVTRIVGETCDVTTALQEADAACYAAKDRGRNRIHVHRHDDLERAKRQGEMQWIHRLTAALDEERILLYRQPIVALGETREYTGCEILLRLETEEGDVVPAATFMPIAERYDLITRLDRLVVERTFAWLAHSAVDTDDIRLCCINLSGRSLNDEAFLAFLLEKADSSGPDRHRICFEITETVAISNLTTTTNFIGELKRRGFLFALDDFGSGLSSFAYLKSLPVDFIKIDGAFVRDVGVDPVDHAMVRAINDMGHVLGKRTIAEFVENEQTATLLQELGVDFGQGSFYGHALPVPSPYMSSGGPKRSDKKF